MVISEKNILTMLWCFMFQKRNTRPTVVRNTFYLPEIATIEPNAPKYSPMTGRRRVVVFESEGDSSCRPLLQRKFNLQSRGTQLSCCYCCCLSSRSCVTTLSQNPGAHRWFLLYSTVQRSRLCRGEPSHTTGGSRSIKMAPRR